MQIRFTSRGCANLVEQISTQVKICTWVQIATVNATCYNNLYNLNSDFDKWPVFSILPKQNKHRLWCAWFCPVLTSAIYIGVARTLESCTRLGNPMYRSMKRYLSLQTPCMITEYLTLRFPESAWCSDGDIIEIFAPSIAPPPPPIFGIQYSYRSW